MLGKAFSGVLFKQNCRSLIRTVRNSPVRIFSCEFGKIPHSRFYLYHLCSIELLLWITGLTIETLEQGVKYVQS